MTTITSTAETMSTTTIMIMTTVITMITRHHTAVRW